MQPKYGAKQQLFAEYDKSELVGDEEKTQIQKITGIFLWYGCRVDGTILTPLSAIAAKQSKPTVNTTQRGQQIMDYLTTQEPVVLTYCKSHMVLAVHSDASYLNEEEARSRDGGHHFLSEDIPFPPTTAQFTTSLKSLRALCCRQPKLNWVPCIFLHARQLRNASF